MEAGIRLTEGNGSGRDTPGQGGEADAGHERLDEERKPVAARLAGETALSPDDPLAIQRDAILDRQYEGVDHMGG